jgi:CO/xanthine dehydrogenase FAD-binding subunit
MNDVRYFSPTEVGEAVSLLAECGERATILAGGTDLVRAINYHELWPEVLLYIGKLDLDFVKGKKGQLVIGAGTPVAKLVENELVVEKFGILAEAASQLGTVPIRTTATIGGNLGNASPAADLVPPLMVMDAELKLVGTDGKRTVPIKDFFTGPGETVLKTGELITEIHVPLKEGETVFLKLGKRKAQTCAVASVAVRLQMEDSECVDARIVVGSMAPTALRCIEAEDSLKGKALNEDVIAECAEKAVAATSPIDDQRATAWYRKKAGKALIARALAQAAGLES